MPKITKSGPGIGFLDNRFVNVTGDTMSGDLKLTGSKSVYLYDGAVGVGLQAQMGIDGMSWWDNNNNTYAGVGPNLSGGAYTEGLVFVYSSQYGALLDVTAFTSEKIVAFQDAAGTLPLLEVAQTFTAAQTITPAADGTSIFNVTKADTTSVLNVDTTNARVGINEATPTASLHVVNTEDNANVTIFNLEGKRPTPTNNDTMYIYYRMYNDTPASFEYARTTITAEDITTDSEEGSLLFEVARGGTLETVLKMSATTVVVNEPGADRDFRIEASGEPNALFVEGSSGNVGIGTTGPLYKLDVNGGSITSQLHFSSSVADSGGYLTSASASNFFLSAGASYLSGTGWVAKGTVASIIGGGSSGQLGFYTNAGLTPGNTFSETERMRISGTGGLSFGSAYVGTNPGANNVIISGNVGIGVTDPDTKLEILNAGNQLKLSFDGTDNAIFAVDTAGDLTITPSGSAVILPSDLLFTGDGSGLAFAEIYAADASDTITITTAGKANKVQVTSFTANGVSNNMTPDHTNDHITVTKAGMYFCAVSMHLLSAGGGGADTIGYSVYKNNGATEFTNLHGQRDLSGGGGDEGSVTLSGIIDLAVNDTIEVWIWNVDSTDDVVIDDINLSLTMVGGT